MQKNFVTTNMVLTRGEPLYLRERLQFQENVALHVMMLHFTMTALEFTKKNFSYFGPQFYTGSSVFLGKLCHLIGLILKLMNILKYALLSAFDKSYAVKQF